MTDLALPRRKFLVGALASLFVAPAIVRASSLMPLRGESLLQPVVQVWDIGEESLNYLYWINLGGVVVKMSAREIMAAPPGVVQPWLPGEKGVIRPADIHRGGLVLARQQGIEDATFAGAEPRRHPFA